MSLEKVLGEAESHITDRNNDILFSENGVRLKDKVVIVTGGGRGMGRAYSLGLAREGARVIVNYVANEKAAQEIVEEISKAGGTAYPFKADVGTKTDVQQMVDFTVEKFDRLDVMISNAGLVHKEPLVE